MELEKLVIRILKEAEKNGSPKRRVIEKALRRFAENYKLCAIQKEKENEDNSAYNFINIIFREDLVSSQIFMDFYDKCKKTIKEDLKDYRPMSTI